MKKIIVIILLTFSQLTVAQKPPLAPSIPTIDEYHGVKITDEYRNLENLKDSTVLNWMKAQGNYTQKTLELISKKSTFLKKIQELDKRNKFYFSDLNITLDKKYFYLKMKSDENVFKIYSRQGFKGEEKLVYDPKSYKPENKKTYIISYYKPSHDGTKVAIGLTEGGKEIAEIIIYDLTTNTLLPEIITNTWPSDLGGIEWLNDDTGFIYFHIPNIDINSDEFIKNGQAVVHKLRTNANEFRNLFSKENNPELNINKEDFPIIKIASIHDNYAFGTIGGAYRFKDMYYCQINNYYTDKNEWKPFCRKEDKIRLFVTKENDVFYLSELNNKSCIGKTSLSNPDFKNQNIIIPEIKDEIITNIDITKDGLFFTTSKNGVVAKLYFYKEGKTKQIQLPFSVGNLRMRSIDVNMSDFWISYSGWTQDNKRYKYDVVTNTFTPENFSESAQYPEFNNIIVEEIEIKTHDGLDLPLTIIYKKGLKKDGKNKAILFGYGSHSTSLRPYFNSTQLAWVADGGILVKTHVRGGGEKGEAWHNGGFKETKPNTWKDFISSAEYLIKQGYTSPNYIGAWGASAGGILIGRAITERPDLFKAAVVEVGMLNTIRSETTPNGPNNIKEFGTVTKENEFKALLEMDAFQHIKNGIKYPATLVKTGMNDPRVIAWEPAKFAAKLQANNISNNPILLDIDMDGGHGGDVSNDIYLKKTADTFNFFYWQLGDKRYKIKKKK